MISLMQMYLMICNKEYIMAKKIPQRMCVCCKNMFDKSNLIRVVHTESGYVIDDKINGRSAYVCTNHDCVSKTISKHLLNRSFKQNVPQELYDNLDKVGKNNANK